MRAAPLEGLTGVTGRASLIGVAAPSPLIGKCENRPWILHGSGCAAGHGFGHPTRIGGDVDGLTVGTDGSVAITVVGLEVTAHVTGRGLAVRSERQDIEGAALQRGYQQNSIPARNACAL